MKKSVLFLMCLLMSCPCAMAQEAFWGFDDNGKELIVPPECDNTLDRDELYDIGMRLLDETGYAKQGAAYCLMASALDNNPKAQYQVAHLYYKGILLPKSDLAAYKWATLGALNGDADADKLGAQIEQFLSIEDIEASTQSLESLLPAISEVVTRDLENEIAYQQELKNQIAKTRAQNADLMKFGRIRKSTLAKYKKAEVKTDTAKSDTKTEKTLDNTKSKMKKSIISNTSAPEDALEQTAPNTRRAKPNEAIFSRQDIDNAPMPQE